MLVMRGLHLGSNAAQMLSLMLDKERVVEEVKRVNRGQLADATINVSDHATAAATAVATTKMHGVMVQIAQPTNVSVPFAELVFRDIRIHGSLISTYSEWHHKESRLTLAGSRGECQKMLKL